MIEHCLAYCTCKRTNTPMDPSPLDPLRWSCKRCGAEVILPSLTGPRDWYAIDPCALTADQNINVTLPDYLDSYPFCACGIQMRFFGWGQASIDCLGRETAWLLEVEGETYVHVWQWAFVCEEIDAHPSHSKTIVAVYRTTVPEFLADRIHTECLGNAPKFAELLKQLREKAEVKGPARLSVLNDDPKAKKPRRKQ